MPQAFRGMTGAVRQAAIDAGLEKKIRTDLTTMYNDKNTSSTHDRRFNWERCLLKKLTETEWKRFLECVDTNLKSYDLTVVNALKFGPNRGYRGSVMIYVKAGVVTTVDELRKKAKELGYRLVKI